MQQVVGDPAEQHLAQPGMAVAAHHHEVDLEPLGLFNERSRDVVRAVADAMQRRIDPVVLKMIDCIKTDQRLELGRMLFVDDYDSSGLRLVQIGIASASARADSATVPGNEGA